VSWRETGREVYRVGVMILWRCHDCGKRAVTIGEAALTPCSCWSEPRVAKRTFGRDPTATR
jgi:hypothetical protein